MLMEMRALKHNATLVLRLPVGALNHVKTHSVLCVCAQGH